MDLTFHLPGTLTPEINVRRRSFWLGQIEVFVNGQRLRPVRFKRLTYEVPMPDGSVTRLRLKGEWSGLRAVVGDREVQLEPKLRGHELALVVLPLGLIAVGGLVGGVIGLGASAVNRMLVRRPMRDPTKVASLLAVSMLAAGLWLGVAYLLSPVRQLPVGACLKGVELQTVQPDAPKVACTSPHGGEVVGLVVHPESGAFPGDKVVGDFANDGCLTAFADYVGIDFQDSVLDMVLFVPTQETWFKGDRVVNCVAVSTNGNTLTGSVRGTAR